MQYDYNQNQKSVCVSIFALVAQLEEHSYNQWKVVGSNPTQVIDTDTDILNIF